MSTELMTPVRSSTLQAVAYDEASRTLFVQFRSSATYEYRDVPPETYGAMLAAHSIGRYFTAKIRDHFSTVKLDSAAAVLTRMQELAGFRARLAERDAQAQERQRAFQRGLRALIRGGSRPVVPF
jgi:hypothetical protein